jgi:DNA-binding IclR family transcriptional regulator
MPLIASSCVPSAVSAPLDDGEFDEEVRCAAMPVRDFSGQVVGAIGISGPVWRLSFQALQSRAKALAAAAAELSSALGAAGEAR